MQGWIELCCGWCCCSSHNLLKVSLSTTTFLIITAIDNNGNTSILSSGKRRIGKRKPEIGNGKWEMRNKEAHYLHGRWAGKWNSLKCYQKCPSHATFDWMVYHGVMQFVKAMVHGMAAKWNNKIRCGTILRVVNWYDSWLDPREFPKNPRSPDEKWLT